MPGRRPLHPHLADSQHCEKCLSVQYHQTGSQMLLDVAKTQWYVDQQNAVHLGNVAVPPRLEFCLQFYF